MLLTPENILATTRKGLLLYLYILKEYFPKKDLLSLLKNGRPVPNPFVAGGQLLIQCQEDIYCHQDLQQPGFKGTALDFANHHFRAATLPELYYLLNQNLRLGLKIPSEELLEQLLKSEADARLSKFSYFRAPISNTRPSESLNLPQLYTRIAGPLFEQQTQALRQLEDPKQARQYKAAHFPYVTFGGCFEKRSDKQLLQPSGLLVMDLDDLPEVAPVREALIAQTSYETELLFVSPSGNGLKWVTAYSPQQISHQEYFRELSCYLEAVFALTPDPSGRDLSRACFICRDEEVFIHRRYLFSGEDRGQRAEVDLKI